MLSSSAPELEVPDTFGELLKYLRRRARLTQLDLAVAVGYSREQITRLENNQGAPDHLAVKALFVPALDLASEPELAARLNQLAASTRTKKNIATTAERAKPQPTNLTAPLTRFIGREREIAEVKRLLGTTRLLALTGAGGVGKTRLAIQVGFELLPAYAGGVWIAELAPLREPALLTEVVAAAFNLPSRHGRNPEKTLTGYLRDKPLLLILDNCEHLLVACARLAETLLRAAPQLSILATGRESLGILSATTWRVPSLTLPDVDTPIEQLAETEAVRLFVDRAVMGQPDFALSRKNAPYVAEICRRLDGVPLAIELAATCVRALPVEQFAGLLSDRFRLLTGGSVTAPPRHRTLRSMIDWSYDLLSESERVLLRQLAVFAGGCDLDAVKAVYGADALELMLPLVDKSLVGVEEHADTIRYSLLETIREYALEKLVQANELDAARNRHLGYYAAFAEEHGPRLRGLQQRSWYQRFDAEQDNFLVALDWAIRSENAGVGLQLFSALSLYWFFRGYRNEGVRWAHALFALAGEADARLHGRALIWASNLAGISGDYPSYREWLREGQALAEQTGDGEALAWASLIEAIGLADMERVNALLAEARTLAHTAGDTWLEGNVLFVWGDRARGWGKLERAETLYAESVRLLRTVGDRDLIALPLGNLGRLAFERGDYTRAQAAYEESIALSREMDNTLGVANWRLQMANLKLRQGDYTEVKDALADCLPTFHDFDVQEAIADCFALAAALANAQGEAERAAALLGASERILERFNLVHQVIDPTSSTEFARTAQASRARLSESSFRAAWERGRGLTAEQAVAEAMHGLRARDRDLPFAGGRD